MAGTAETAGSVFPVEPEDGEARRALELFQDDTTLEHLIESIGKLGQASCRTGAKQPMIDKLRRQI